MNLLYEQSDFPVFQNRMYATVEEAVNCPTGDIRLIEDQRTGLVYNEAFRSELIAYDEHYQNEQAISYQFQCHLGAVGALIKKYMGTRNLIEVGCGKGFFLEMLLEMGFDVTGFDPTYEGTNPKIVRRNFEPGLINRANGMILRHVLEHIESPLEFLQHLRLANNGCGKIYIEVPCFDWICQHRAWFDIYYEHVNYFRMSDFERIFGEVIHSGKLFGGQYIYAVAELGSLREPRIDKGNRVVFPKEFTRTVFEGNGNEYSQRAVWGGASKGVIFALLKKRAGFPIHTIIDINPAKQGKFIPGTGLRVSSPHDGLAVMETGSTIFVMNSNYLEEIRAMTANKFNYVVLDLQYSA